jgi:thiamine-phosphate pyrophosphorylase
MTELHLPLLVAITDRWQFRQPPSEWAREAIAGGADLIQIREKDLTEGDLLEFAAQFAEIDPRRLQINGNDRIARLLGFGLHLPEATSAPAKPSRPYSRSIHGLTGEIAGPQPDFVIAGHIFATPSKSGLAPRELPWLREVAASTSLAMVAIGGINAGNAGECIRAGASGVAVIGAIAASADPRQAAQELRAAIDTAWNETKEHPMTITLNGKPAELEPDTSIHALLVSKELTDRLVVVEINGLIIPRERFAEVLFEPGDVVEIVHFVGGGD